MGKRLRNLIGTLLLVTAIAVTQIPVSDVEAVDASSASDFQMDGTTLVKYNGTAEDVSISDSVEKIESEAFADNTSIKRVTVGASVEEIGARAFSGCMNLESVTIPDSVKIIENAAFSGCPSLRVVTVGTGLKSLGNGAFAGDYSLANVDFDSDNPWFICDDGAIYNKNGGNILYQVLAGRKASAYGMPSSVSQIKPYAFWGDYNLEAVEISSNVKEISGYAFSNCKNLKDVGIPFSVKNIDMKAFEDCVRLRNIKIPASVSTIHSTAFDGCTKLTIEAETGSYAKSFAENLVLEDIDVSEYEEAPIPAKDDETTGNGESVKNLPPADYYHEVSRMNAMAEEEDSAVKGKTRVIGQEAYILVDNAKATVNVGTTGGTLGGEPEHEEEDLDTVPGIAGSDDAKGGAFPKYTVVNKDTIAAQAYYDDDMMSYEFPDGIRKIGEFAFARAELTAVRIPEGVEEIGYAAFYHCDELTDVVIPQSVKEISVAAFTKTPWLDQWKAGGNGDFLIVGDGVLLAYRGSGGMVTIPGNVRQIGAEAFINQTKITSVQIPDSVEVIGEAAFAGCSSLSAVQGAEGVREIRDRAFAGCPMDTVHISASVERVGLLAYDNANADGVVVFDGESLPKLSYEDTATKLYRDDYRDLSFKGCNLAVIPAGITDLTDTVLSDDVPGFTGVICRRTGEGAEGEQGKLQIVVKRGNGPVAGDTCQINGQTFVLEEAEDKLSDTKTDRSAKEGIIVNNNSSTISQDGLVNAVMQGGEGSYQIDIADSVEAKQKIEEVYKKIYGNKLPYTLRAYEIDMRETDTGIPITSLGKQRVEITIPIPAGVGTENLHVVCLDADGQLEEVPNRITAAEGGDTLTFTVSHFSPYGIYNYNSGNTVVSDVKDGQAVFMSLGKKDDSPDTGDYSIHPKWFFGAGLFFAAIAVFFYRGGRRKGKKI